MVDVPILEAWKAFVVYPEGVRYDSDVDDDDLSGAGIEEIYSQVYYTSDDTLSVGSSY